MTDHRDLSAATRELLDGEFSWPVPRRLRPIVSGSVVCVTVVGIPISVNLDRSAR